VDRFSTDTFLKADQVSRHAMCRELAAEMHATMARDTRPFHEVVYDLVSVLRTLGHDLWSSDESDELQVWAPNYQQPSGPGIVVTFTSEAVTVEWSER
jgi:hypothetical protein